MDKRTSPTPAETRKLFDNEDPTEVWAKTGEIILDMAPDYDFTSLRNTYNDVLQMFFGTYPGYFAIRTPYHDLGHTLNVFLCAVRLMHGVHVSGTRLSSTEMSQIMIAALMHDIGYAQTLDDKSGTGAQYTRIHVDRGVSFMRHYLAVRQLPASWEIPLECMIRSTDHMKDFALIAFPNAHIRLLGQIVGTADLVGQMADDTYLEKLQYLYSEFKEAHLGNYQDAQDLMRKTRNFYEVIRHKLDEELGSNYLKLAQHFKNYYGDERNYYLESIEKNMAYLTQAAERESTEDSLAMLRRRSTAAKAVSAMPAPPHVM